MTGVDWKSLCMPACLPLTINYFPDEASLKKHYFEYHYTMVIEDALEDNLVIDRYVFASNLIRSCDSDVLR